MSEIVFGREEETAIPLGFAPERTKTTVYIIGSPDEGKSTLLGNLAEQFCAAGEGVLLLDIKGDLAREVASRTRHLEKVVYVKMGEIVFPGPEPRLWTINPFEGHRSSAQSREQLAINVLESFELMGRAELGQMANIRDTLEDLIGLAMALPDPTILDLYLLVVDQAYRQSLLQRFRHIDHVTARSWRDLDDPKFPARERRSLTNTTRNRLKNIARYPAINLAVGQYHGTLKLREWLDAGKMVLIDLGEPIPRPLGVDIGNLIMSQVVSQTYLRSENDRGRTWRLVVDEFHEFAGKQFANIITDVRSFNVFPVLAHQDTSQIGDHHAKTLQSAVGHAKINLNLRRSREDRVTLASHYGQEHVDEYYAIKHRQAVMHFTSSLTGTSTKETLDLNNWWGDPVPGQLAELQMAAYPHTVAKSELVEHNRKRYWDYLDGGAVRDTRNSNVPSSKRKPKAQADPPSEVRPRPGVSPTVPAGPTVEPPPSPPRPGIARPPRAVDQRDDAGPALPRPPRRKPGPQKP